MKADVVVVGGGIIGSSIAWHLSQAGVAAVTVIERDPTYEYAATPRSNGGIRRLFSRPENIQMASYGLEFYRSFASTLGDADADIGFRKQGYLFVSDAGGEAQMEANYEVQRANGVPVEALTPAMLADRFPSIQVTDVKLAVLSAEDAWIDPHAALQGFKRAARAGGVTYTQDEVVGLAMEGGRIRSAELKGGDVVEADLFVNACGAWCAGLAEMVDVHLPVQPMSRESYFFRTEQTLEALPFVKTETDLAIRPEGNGYVGGLPDWSAGPGWNFDVSEAYFNEAVWPALARRFPAMDTLRLERAWRGHYARSDLDLSPYISFCDGGPENFLLANGFSGHGIMHAPATGRAIAELAVHGRFETLDLSCFTHARVRAEQPYRELGIV